jgi:hypothetical protein
MQVKGAAWRVARAGWAYGATGQIAARPGQPWRAGAGVILISAMHARAGLVGRASSADRFEEAYPVRRSLKT